MEFSLRVTQLYVNNVITICVKLQTCFKYITYEYEYKYLWRVLVPVTKTQEPKYPCFVTQIGENEF